MRRRADDLNASNDNYLLHIFHLFWRSLLILAGKVLAAYVNLLKHDLHSSCTWKEFNTDEPFQIWTSCKESWCCSALIKEAFKRDTDRPMNRRNSTAQSTGSEVPMQMFTGSGSACPYTRAVPPFPVAVMKVLGYISPQQSLSLSFGDGVWKFGRVLHGRCAATQ